MGPTTGGDRTPAVIARVSPDTLHQLLRILSSAAAWESWSPPRRSPCGGNESGDSRQRSSHRDGTACRAAPDERREARVRRFATGLNFRRRRSAPAHARPATRMRESRPPRAPRPRRRREPTCHRLRDARMSLRRGSRRSVGETLESVMRGGSGRGKRRRAPNLTVRGVASCADVRPARDVAETL